MAAPRKMPAQGLAAGVDEPRLMLTLAWGNMPVGVGVGSSMSMSIMPGRTGTSLWFMDTLLVVVLGVKLRLAPVLLDCTALMAAMRMSCERLACSSS